MAYPPAYDRTFSFTDWETAHPGEPKPGSDLDAEFDAVSNALTATQDNLALIQRSDGALANDSVGEDQLQDDVFDGIVDGVTADAEAAAAAAAASAALAASSASAADTSATDAATSAGVASGAAAQAGVSQGIAQGAAVDAADFAADADNSADVAVAAANDTAGSVAATEAAVQRAFEWAELLTGPVLPAPPGWPEAVDDGMFSSKWWAIRAREYNSTETIDLGTAGADIGEAFDIWDAIPGNDLGVGLTYATWGSPPQTYVLTDRGNPSDPASWTNITGGPGPPGPGNTLTIGTVTTGAVGSPANATITGASPNQVLNLTLPTGATGPAGPTGVAGPPNALAIGTVTTGAPGSPAGATITGTSPSQTLNLTIPQGPQGIQGIQGIQGPPGAGLLADPSALVGLTAVPGTSLAAIRADGAPALSQAITPTWTGLHNFSSTAGAAGGAFQVVSNTPTYVMWVMSQAANARAWFTQGAGANYSLGIIDDGVSVVKMALQITRAVTTVTNLAFGNATDNPTYSFLGTGVVTSGGVHRGPSGTAGAPTYSFSVDTDTGLFLSALGVVDLAAGGVSYFSILDGSGMPVRVNTGQLGVPDGTAAAPAYSFTNDPNTGIYRYSAKVLGFTTNGTLRAILYSAALELQAGVQLLVIDGTAAAPALAFANDTNSGFYRLSSDYFGLTLGGVHALSFVHAGVSPQIAFNDGAAAYPPLTFDADRDTGLYRPFANTLAVTAGATNITFWNAGSMIMLKPIYATDGTAGAPAYAFDNDPDTGMYRYGAGAIAFACDASRVLYLSTAAIELSAQALFVNGNAAAPAISFQSDPDTGIYHPFSDGLAISAGGVAGAYILSSGLYAGPAGSASAPSISFINDSDTGFYNVSANYFAAMAGGILCCGFFNASANGQALFATGASGTPPISFDGDRNTGFYSQASDVIGCTTGGVLVASIHSGGITAVGFTTSSSRAVKRETGAPSRPANILARLRPLLYRLLDGDDREQLGLIAEEVHEVCPQLSDGKTVAYDRLAILLLAAWQDEHLEAA